MTSYVKESRGLSPKVRSNVMAAAKNTAVTEESARAEEEKVWEDVRDETAAGSEDTCRPCGEDVTMKSAEEAPIRIAKDPGDPTEEEFQKHCVTHLPYRRWCPICVKAKRKRRQSRKQGRVQNQRLY